MSGAFVRTGVAYGKLGLGTSSELIVGRSLGIEAAAKAIKADQVAELLLVIFGRGSAAAAPSFASHFANDPTLSLKAADQEAVLLASSIADYIMTEEFSVASEVALGIVTGAMGGMRPMNDFYDIATQADAALATLQGEYASPPTTRKQATAPAKIAAGIETIKGTSHDHGQLGTLMPAVQSAIEQLQKYSDIGGRKPVVLKKLADLQTQENMKAAAAKTLHRINYIYPNDEELHRKLAALYSELGDKSGAIREYEALVAMKPQDQAGARYGLAAAYKAANRIDDAKDQVLLALEAAPGFRPAQKLLLELNRTN